MGQIRKILAFSKICWMRIWAYSIILGHIWEFWAYSEHIQRVWGKWQSDFEHNPENFLADLETDKHFLRFLGIFGLEQKLKCWRVGIFKVFFAYSKIQIFLGDILRTFYLCSDFNCIISTVDFLKPIFRKQNSFFKSFNLSHHARIKFCSLKHYIH